MRRSELTKFLDQPGHSLLQAKPIASLAFPNLEYMPAIGPKRSPVPRIPQRVAAALLSPEVSVRSRSWFSQRAPVHMPKTAMYEDHRLNACKHQIGFAGQPLVVQPITQSGCMERSAHHHFRFGVASANPRHIEAALLGCMNVRQK